MISVLTAQDALRGDLSSQKANGAYIRREEFKNESSKAKSSLSRDPSDSPAIPSSSTLVSGLADKIANNARILEQTLDIKDRPSGDQIAIQTEASGDENVRQARVAVIDLCRSLLNLVTGPSEMLKNMVLIVSIV